MVELDSLNLSSQDASYMAGDISVGAALAYSRRVGDATVSIEGRVAYLHGFGDDRPDRWLGLAGAPSTPFVIQGTEANEDRFAVGFGLAAQVAEGLTMSARYDGAFGSSSESQAGHLSIGYEF